MKPIASTKVRSHVEERKPFKTHGVNNGMPSFQGHWYDFSDDTRLYIVWTYQVPLYIYDPQNNKWYGNEAKYSPTSSRHRSQAMPYSATIHWRSPQTMTEFAQNGLVGAVRRRFKEAA